ncbi:protochlorophyllide-dependent translocon component 52, chloroplastic-like [Phragmites australis]|uniref:protochlorophyllide-dependent translocon component 52, chloroplastic-like n=1 Tax=Phragmites australis TaxID=29695 RepID=UPI002D7775D8|nr:protochlorophyllide-dependent translocon component 52, chloroplastic-like [Phragmites australis]
MGSAVPTATSPPRAHGSRHSTTTSSRLLAQSRAAKPSTASAALAAGRRHAMDPLSLLFLPRVPRRSLPLTTAAPLIYSRRPGGTCLVQRRWRRAARLSVSAVAAETPRTEEPQSPSPSGQERFDWLDQWYPLAPVCDLDPRAPHGKTVLGLSVVAWYDRGAGEWRVFDDACPHRLAPLSEGRIDDKGRLQCVYHGWCFDGAGSCKFIPQAPALGPPVHKNSKACVASYPCVVQNNILWFYPRAEAEYKDVLQRKRPPYIAEIDDPEFVTVYGIRDLFYGYDVLVENLMDPAHVPYAHKGIMRGIRKKEDPGRVEYDKEGGGPIKMKIEQANIEGFLSPQERGYFQFVAPCTFYGSPFRQEGKQKTPRVMLVFFCVPVAPGRSRVIWAFPRNVGVWLHKITPRWFYHIGQNLILDSDIYLLHVEERKFAAAGLDSWQKACYVPTSSDSMVIAFRIWFRKFCKNQVGWATPQVDQLPPTPTKDKLLERYWSHVAQCTSCNAALKAMKTLEVALQVASVAVVGFLAVAKGTLVTSAVQRAVVVSAAVLCFAASRWLANFIEKNFYFQDYVHAYK